MGNYPPIKKEKLETLVKEVCEKEDANFVVKMTDTEILNVVKKFLLMRRWIQQGKFPLLCSTCGKPMNFVGFKYREENFLFWHCFSCHTKPRFEENETQITFEKFKELLQHLINQRRRKHD